MSFSKMRTSLVKFYQTYKREVRFLDPRATLPVKNFIPNSWSEFMSFTLFRGHSYAGVHSIKEMEKGEYDKFFIDIDAENLEDAVDRLYRVLDRVVYHNLSYTVIFSGKKGFHVYIRYPGKRWVMTSDPLEYRARAEHFLDTLGIRGLVDEKVSKDRRRVARIPYSYHPRSGLYATPLDMEKLSTHPVGIVVEHIKRISKTRPYDRPIVWDKPEKSSDTTPMHELLGYDPEAPHETTWDKRSSAKPIEKLELDIPMPPCIERIVDGAKRHDNLSHYERFTLATYLLRFMDVEEIHKVYALLPDYNPNVTEYQLRQIKTKGYRVPSCHTLANWGLCPVDRQYRCPYYPSIQKFLDGLNGGDGK